MRMWDLNATPHKECVKVLEGHQGAVTCAIQLKDGRVLSAVSPPQQCITVLMFGGVPRKPVPFAFDPEPLFADARVLQEQHWQEARRSMVVARYRRG